MYRAFVLGNLNNITKTSLIRSKSVANVPPPALSKYHEQQSSAEVK